MYRGKQSLMKNIGENGCYILSILEGIGIQNTDAQLDLIKTLMGEGHLSKDCYVNGEGYLTSDLSVKDNNALAARLGCTYKYTTIKPTDEKVYIKEYYNARTGFTHFVLCVDGIDYDTLDSSVTVNEGIVRSYRIYKRK